MRERSHIQNILVLLLSGLLSLPALPLPSTAQTGLARRRSEDAQKHRKLAPDLEETLAQTDDAEFNFHQTLGQLRRAKTTSKPSLAGVWSTPAPTATQRFIVNLSALTTDITLQACLLKLGGRVHQMHATMGVATVELPLGRVRELAAEKDIEYISPDRPLQAFGHLETATGADQARPLARMNGVANLDGSGIGIAVIDSGVDRNHKLIRPAAEHPGIVAATDFIGTDAQTDRFGHGTFVASVAVGSAALKSGTYEGIAPSANLINLKVLNDDGVGLTSSLIAALNWCVLNRLRYNIRVINLSIGTPAKDSYRNDPLCLAARRAHTAGILVVAAAGNEGKDRFGNKLYGGIHSPGIDPSVLTVGAANTFKTDRRSDDRVASYSSRGPTRGYYADAAGVKHYDNLLKPDLVAPGNQITSASSRNPDEEDDLNNLVVTYPSLAANTSVKVEDRTMFLNGTSVAAPVVTGAAALLFELNANLTPNLVKAILMYSAQPIPFYNTLEQGAGLLNIEGAVRIARLIRSNPNTLMNGAAMLTGALPTSQTSFLANESCPWGQSIITNYCFLYGSNLMTLWQGMYQRSLLLSDATKVVNGTIQKVPGLTSSGVLNSGGVVFANGGSADDDRLLAAGVVFADGTTYASGVVFADGRFTADAAAVTQTGVKAKVVVPGD